MQKPKEFEPKARFPVSLIGSEKSARLLADVRERALVGRDRLRALRRV